MSDHFDHGPAFERLSALMGWDNLPAGPPPVTHTTPRAIPPVHHDTASVQRRTRVLRALARIRREAT